MGIARYKLWSLPVQVLLACGLSSAYAQEPESAARTADVMIHCALLNAQVVQRHGADAAFISAGKVRMFLGIAGDLTNEAYVIESIEKSAPVVKVQAQRDTTAQNDQLNAALSRCSKMEFSPAVLARLQLLIEEKKTRR